MNAHQSINLNKNLEYSPWRKSKDNKHRAMFILDSTGCIFRDLLWKNMYLGNNFHIKTSWKLNRPFGKWSVTKTWSTGYPNLVVVFARHLLIKDYSNEYTRNQVENHKQTTLILLYPEAHQDLGKDYYYQLLDFIFLWNCSRIEIFQILFMP